MDRLPRIGDWQTKDVEGELSVYRYADFHNLITITGPDRAANAALFIRAQHMGELVEAMKPRLSKKARAELEQTAEAEENDGSAALADAIRFLLEQEDRRAAILAKIKGAK